MTTLTKKTIYYTDEQNDDFALTRDAVRPQPIGADYRYDHGFLWNAAAWVLYRCIATPLLWLYCRVFYGVRIKGRANILHVRGGCFLYGNHTQNIIDAFLPTLAAFPKRCDIITADDAVSVPFIRHITPVLGAVPLPSTLAGMRIFQRSLGARVQKGHVLAIYPEAHIWPYYNKIRPFPDGSFAYPHKFGVPALPFTVTYRKRRILKFAPPAITLIIGEPVYPDPDCSPREGRKKMRDAVFAQMCAASENSYEYIQYIKGNDA